MVQAAKLYYDLDRNRSKSSGAGSDPLAGRPAAAGGARNRHRSHRDRAAVAAAAGPQGPAAGRAGACARPIVVPGTSEGRRARPTRPSPSIAVAQAAGAVPRRAGAPAELVGVSWGRTMTAVAKRLPPRWNEGVQVVLLNGATAHSRALPSAPTPWPRGFAEGRPPARPPLLPVPAIVGNPGHPRGAGGGPGDRRASSTSPAHAPVALLRHGSRGQPGSVHVESGYPRCRGGDRRRCSAPQARSATCWAAILDAEGRIVGRRSWMRAPSVSGPQGAAGRNPIRSASPPGRRRRVSPAPASSPGSRHVLVTDGGPLYCAAQTSPWWRHLAPVP